MNPMRILAAAAALGTLAACGAGSDDGGVTVSSSEAAREFAADSAEAQRLVDRNAGLSPTAPGDLPLSGRADYEGVVALAVGGTTASFDSADLLGEVDFTANFGTGALTGYLDDFNTRDGREVRGDLYLRNGRITGGDFTADIEGRLSGPANAPGNVSGDISGSFLGAGGNALSGTGRAVTDAGQAGLVFQGVRDFD